MTNTSKRAFTFGLLAAATGLAVAQVAPTAETATADDARPGGRHKHRGERWAEHRAKRLEAFKEKLKLSDKQEEAWDRYTQAMSQPQQPRDREARAKFRELSTPERLDLMLERQAQRQDRFQQRADAVKEFYAQLTPEQQKIFDSRPMMQRRGGGRHGHGHGHRKGRRHFG